MARRNPSEGSRKMVHPSRWMGWLLPLICVTSLAQSPLQLEADRNARSAYVRGDALQATLGLGEAVRANPFDPVALNNLAVTLASQGDYQSALSTLERAYRLAPGRRDIATNLMNLKTWITQESHFPLASRAQSPLLFPRAEDMPPELPGLWAPLVPTPTPMPSTPIATATTPTSIAPASAVNRKTPPRVKTRKYRSSQTIRIERPVR